MRILIAPHGSILLINFTSILLISFCPYVSLDDIAADGEGKFEVSSGGRQLSVDFTVPSCSCEDWCLHGYPCKHFFAIFRLVPGWDWSALPAAYTASPRMVASAEILAEGFTTPLQEPAIQLEENIPETADELPTREVGVKICV